MLDKFNNSMLGIARSTRGMTQTEFVNLIPNLNQGNLSKMELGKLIPTDEMLENISKILDYPISFFYQSTPSIPVGNFHYRKRTTFASKDLANLEARLEVIRLAIDNLLRSVQIPNFIPLQIEASASPIMVAQRLRNLFGIIRGPIIEITNLFEKHGIIVYFLKDCPPKFDGITILTESNIPIIIVNSEMPNDRKRFTLCHELGHLYMHIVNRSDIIKSLEDYEQEANSFAAELLMPASECTYQLLSLSYHTLGQLKQYWGVSKAAIIRRARDLAIINEQRYTSLMVQLSQMGERKVEKGFISIREPQILSKVITAYLNDLHYTIEEVSEVAKLNLKDFHSLFINKDLNSETKIVSIAI